MIMHHWIDFLAHHTYPFLIPPILFFLALPLLLWSLVIKGMALWYAARNGQSHWFIALLIFNTLGILELVYLIWFRKEYR